MMPVPAAHFINGAPLVGPWPATCEALVVGMGCFWGAERKFWQAPGVYSTSVGYAGGATQHPSYEQVCSGRTGHTEVVMVVKTLTPQEASDDLTQHHPYDVPAIITIPADANAAFKAWAQGI